MHNDRRQPQTGDLSSRADFFRQWFLPRGKSRHKLKPIPDFGFKAIINLNQFDG